MSSVSLVVLKKHSIVLAVALLILFYLFNGIQYLNAQSTTSDEPFFFDYAKRFATGHPERINPGTDNSKMPVSILNILPRGIEQLINPDLKKNDWGSEDIRRGRYITLLLSIGTLLLVFKWASELYGKKAGLFALFIMSLCPNNLANAALVTTDAYSSLFLLASMYFLWKYCSLRTGKHLFLFALSIALSQLVKQSLFHLYIIVPVCLFIYYSFETKPAWHLLLKHCAIFFIVNWLVINLGYYFFGTNTSLGDYRFMSDLFKDVQNIFPSQLPIPLPSPFVTGLDMAKYYDQLGGGYPHSSFGKVTILGNSSTGGNFWYYYLVSIFYKTPISYFILLICAAGIMIRARSIKEWVGNEFFLIMPVIYFLGVMSFFYKTQCGIRHLIFIYPLLIILCAGTVPYINNRLRKLAAIALSIFLIFSVGKYWQNYYPYTNEFILDKKMAYNYVGAGNLEFLQGGFFGKDYLASHPEVSRPAKDRREGIFLVTSAEYLDIWNRNSFDWIAEHKPIGHVAYNWLLVKVENKNRRNTRSDDQR